jgi:ribosomal protein L40E
MNETIWFHDADDEEPICSRCENQCNDSICERCGAENWWRFYQRTEAIEYETD